MYLFVYQIYILGNNVGIGHLKIISVWGVRNYSKTCLKRNAIVPVFFFFFVFTGFRFTKGFFFIKQNMYKKYDHLGLQWRNNFK